MIAPRLRLPGQEGSSALAGSPIMKALVSGDTAFKRSRMNLFCNLKLASAGTPTVETRNSAPSGIHPLSPYSSFSAFRAQLLLVTS